MRPSRRDGAAAEAIGMGWNTVKDVSLVCPMQASVMDQFVELRTVRRLDHFLEGHEIRRQPAQFPVDQTGSSRIALPIPDVECDNAQPHRRNPGP
jgi:hypothetical protein